MSEIAAIIVSIVGSAVTVVGVTIATARILITSVTWELGATNKRTDDLNGDELTLERVFLVSHDVPGFRSSTS